MYNTPYAPYSPMPQVSANMFNQGNAFAPMSTQSVIRVNGENGARAYQMPPNSSALLLDETAPLVWLVQTDGAGYKTVSPYDITPHQSAAVIEQVDTKSLEARIKRLEDYVDEQSHIASSEQRTDGEPKPASNSRR